MAEKVRGWAEWAVALPFPILLVSQSSVSGSTNIPAGMVVVVRGGHKLDPPVCGGLRLLIRRGCVLWV